MAKLVFLLNGFLLVFLIVQLKCFNVIALYSHNIYHRYSDKVVGVLGNAGLPKRDTTEYYTVWSAYDQHRQLSATQQHLPALTFADGGDVTTRIDNLGHLHYAEIYVGTPPVPFLVALDTGSVISWLPCGCKDCARSFTTSKGEKINLNSYNPHSSSTSEVVFCNSPDCWPKKHCPLFTLKPCPYEVKYLSKNTSTKGILVKDTVHLETYDNQSKPIGAPVVFGCGEVETGYILRAASINGLLGLGHAKLDVTNLLSSKGFIRNSFSLCFASNGNGRIAFGDKGDADQMATPLDTPHESISYNIRIEQIFVENVVTNIEFGAVFDSGTTVTHLTDEVYSLITKHLDSFVKDPRTLVPKVPLEYCYTAETSNTSFWTPTLNLKTKGGADFHVINPTLTIISDMGKQIYCLGILKDSRVNIIGQNFMTGYHIVFDRENLILGWKPSACQAKEANTIASSRASLPTMAGILFFILASFSILLIIM